jgi:UDP:flavonoid glycosyltransferase YjiC (YdhE family)
VKKNVLIGTVGSFGDLHPYLAIAIGLKARGHAVTLASCGRYREKVESEGIRFVAIPPHLDNLEYDAEVRRRTMHTFDGTRYVVQEIFMPPLEEQYRILLRECEGMDATLGSLFAMGLTLAAAKRGVPYLHTALQPAAVLSAYDPPMIPAAPFLPWLARLGPRAVQVAYRGMNQANAFLLKKAYELAAQEGMPREVVPPLFGASSPHGNLMLFSRHFMAPQPDFPEPLTMCGFPFYDNLDGSNSGMEPELEKFLAAGDPPVVFTLGTSAVLDPGRFYDEAAGAIRKLGMRAVFLVGPTNIEQYCHLHGDRIFVAIYAPHSKLMPRALANVHQGGIGTTAQALRSGRPMIVVPFSHDQPDNANRCVKLGVGVAIPRKRLTAARLEEALRGIRAHEVKAAELGRLIQSEDAVAAACERIEAIQPSSKRS